MFGTIRKHQTWLWGVIITVIVISFVIYFSPYSRLNSNVRHMPANLGSINGERVTEAQFVHARSEVYLRYFFMSGSWPNDEATKQGGQIDRETYQWLLLIQKQEQMGIRFSPAAAAQAARAMVSHFERAGINSPEAFIEQVLHPRGLDVDDLERFVRHFLGVQELIGTVGLAGELTTPSEVQALYKREHEEVASQAAFFSASNYLAKVTVLPDAVAQFYTNRQALYRQRERVQVSYVRFDLTNYQAQASKELAGMTNLDQQIEGAYRQGGSNFLRELAVKSLDEAKAKVRTAEQRRIEARLAITKAREFADPLFDMNPLRAEDLEKQAKQKGLPVGVTTPFETNSPPPGLGVGFDFVAKAFGRKPDDPFAGPILGSNAVYVIAYDKRIPSEIPPLDQIRPQVVQDYRWNQALALARQAGMDFSSTLTNAIAQGKTFAAVCSAAKVPVIDVPPLSISTRSLPEVEDLVSLNQLKQLAFTTPPGKVSNFQMTPEGGVILYVKAKLPLDENKMKADLPAFTHAVRQNRENEVFNVWLRRELEKGLRDVSLFQQQQPPSMAPTRGQKKT
jgi:peptidyl-prolyl cis-trans isomerase D